MKKLLSLITLLACAGSLYAAGAGTLTPSSVGFESNEGYAADTVISNTLQEAGKTIGNYQWWSAGSDEGETGTIKLYNVAAEPPAEEGGEEVTPASETEAGLPKYVYANQTEGNFVNLGVGNQYLNVETTTGKPLYRTLATWENNFLWVKTNENGEKVSWTDDGDPSEQQQAEEGWHKEYRVNSLADIAGVEIGSEGKVIDTLVQFTASETAPELADGDKLVVWLKQQTEDDKPADWEDEIKVGTKYIYTWTDKNEVIQTREFVVEPNAEPNDEQMAGIPEGAELTTEAVMRDNVWPCYTNLMVTAGQLNGNFTVVKQDFKVSESVEPDKWYRLTIRAIENVTSITGANQPGFAIYLNGEAVACLDNDYQEKLFEEFDVAQLSSTAKGLYDNKQLFISAVESGKNGATALTAVGFDGTGKIDDLTINTVEAGPQFAMGKRLFKVEWDNGLTGFTIVAKASDGTVISTTPFSVEGGAGANEFDFAAGATTYEISALTFASGSTLSEVTATGAAQSSDNGIYSFAELAFAPVVKIGVDTILATVDGTDYSSFAEAIAAAKANGKTLTLAADIYISSQIAVASGETLDIDLAGKTMYYMPVPAEDGATFLPMFALSGGTLNIYTTAEGGAISFDPEFEGALNGIALINGVVGQGYVNLGTSSDKGAYFNGMIMLGQGGTTAKIYSGNFIVMYNPELLIANFLTSCVQSPSTAAYDEDNTYWVVSNAGADTPDDPEPTEYKITIDGDSVNAANATVTVDGEAYDANATYKYTDTDVVIVATANDGYTYTGVTATGWTIALDGTTATYTVSGITANVTVNVPAALQKADEPEGPTSWEEVTKDTQVSDVVDSDSQKALAGSGVTALDIAAWAYKHTVSFDAANGISVTPEALMLNCANTADAIATAKEAFKVDEDIFKDIMENLADLTKVDLSKLEAQYPYATIVLEEVTLGEEASENAKFFKLKMTLK